MKKRLTAALVSLCLLFTLFPAAALAAEEPDGGLCAHHPVHDAACGYTAGSEGTPCAHEHGEDCYAQVTSCVHQHGPECYPAEPAGSTETAPEDPAAPAEPAAAEPTACPHVCSEESGCITKVLDCTHAHDAACGYAPAVEGTPCGYVCELCNSQEGGEAEETAPAPEETAPEETEPTDPEPEPEPPAALAEASPRASHGPHKVCINSSHDDCTHTEIADWQPLDQDVVREDDNGGIGYIIPAGNYYLEADVKIETDKSLFIRSEVVICLNGHRLDFDIRGADQLRVQAALTLCDCQTGENTADVNGEKVTVSGGYLIGSQLALNGRLGATADLYKCNIIGSSHCPVDVASGAILNMYSNANISHNQVIKGSVDYESIIDVRDGSEFNMYGGTISNNTVSSYGIKPSGGVYVLNSSIFNMYGGEISGNRADAGGGVYVTRGGGFNLSGGQIKENEASSGDGGGVLIDNGVFYMTGGSINNNDAESGNGGGIALRYAYFAAISGGGITYNSANGVGGGIYVSSGSQLTISGGVSIESNKAFLKEDQDERPSGQGGGIYVGDGGKVTMTDGRIWSNYAKSSGGGVYMAGGELTLNNVELEYNKGYIGNPASPIDGSAVYMAGGVLTMNGGTITRHNAWTDTGTVYMAGGTFHLNGGSITGNTNLDGSVYLKGGTFQVSGSAQVTGNASDIVLPADGSGIIAIGGPLDSGARLGVTAAEGQTITSGWSAQMPGGDPGAYFTSGTTGLIPVLENGEVVLRAGYWHAITLELNGGTVNSGNVSGYVQGQGVTLPTDVTRHGYDFGGWYENQDCTGNAVTAVGADATGDKTFYAKWEPATYKVTLDPNGGTIAEGENITSYTYGETKELPSSLDTTRTGYIFLGWYDAGGNRVREISDTDYGDKAFTAQWVPITYGVEFNANGGRGWMIQQVFTYDREGYLAYNTFTRTGYEFAEWNTKADGSGTSYANGQAVFNLSATNNETITLYAQWKFATYEVTLEANGGTIADGKNVTEYTYGTGAALPTAEDITRTGYTFEGWYVSRSFSGSPVTEITATEMGAKTYYAKWEPITYTVAFDANGGSGTMTSQPFDYDEEKPLTANGFTRTGHDFTGWSTTEDGTAVYTDQQTVSNLTATDGETITLYAQWKPSTYAVALYPNEGTITAGKDVTSYTYGTGAVLPAAEDITRDGYAFKGWYEDSGFSGSPVVKITDTDTGAKTYYAKWVKLWTVTVTAGDGGRVSGGGTYEENSTVTVTAVPDSGYHFVRWMENGAEVSDDESYAFPLTGDRSLTAEFARSSRGAAYSVTIEDTEHGTVTSSHRTAGRDETVTLTATPDKGYELAELTVTDSGGNEVELRTRGGGRYSFTMPHGRVTVEAVFTGTGAGLPLADVPEEFWARDAIAWAWENGYMNGTSDSTFGPDAAVSRQQVWMILSRLSGADPADMAEARQWAMDFGVSDGSSPGGAVTRQQLAALLYRFAQLQGYDVSVGEDTNILSYTDFADLSEYAVPAMQWACGAGVIQGTSGGRLNPQGTATRAQFAVMLMRFCELGK